MRLRQKILRTYSRLLADAFFSYINQLIKGSLNVGYAASFTLFWYAWGGERCDEKEYYGRPCFLRRCMTSPLNSSTVRLLSCPVPTAHRLRRSCLRIDSTTWLNSVLVRAACWMNRTAFFNRSSSSESMPIAACSCTDNAPSEVRVERKSLATRSYRLIWSRPWNLIWGNLKAWKHPMVLFNST